MHQHEPDLQLLQSLREQQEEQALRQYGQALQALQKANSQLEFFQQQLQDAQSLLESRRRAGCSAEELSRLWVWCASLQSCRSVLEHAAKAARSRARLAFTELLATRHISALLRKWQDHGPHQLQTMPLSPSTPDPALDFLRLFAHTRGNPLWN